MGRLMRTFEVPGDGGPLRPRERPVPTPAAGEVLVRVRARSINARDLPIVEGRYSMPVPPGRIPLSDAAGTVDAVGAGVRGFQVGDRVMSTFHPEWLHGTLDGWGELYGVQRDGWLAEHVAVAEHSVLPVPEHLSFEEAATLPCAALTAFSALDGIGAGDSVLLQGCGGVSMFALQFARLAGARVLITTSGPVKARWLRELGAPDVIDRTAVPEWGDEVRARTGGRGVDRVVEIGGAGTIGQSLRALAHGGLISLVGNLADGAGLDLGAFLGRGATLRAIAVGSRSDFERMIRVLEQHRLHPLIDRAFPFDEAPEAFTHFATKDTIGKIIIGD
ncbi:zinc-dependent alcohol dehydrogenase family protein [Saccharopolyspora gregorii]|uniref:zinc-dependent alcohol dehydrogenase family protein n=1 Tax=Saccharopolyspora gregorii TaxID=33914 RepID=UPI0021ACE7A9|nr:NAD(P)-dependent alcohol dehydrogenase [Saccharopolyspora gregorii]